MSRCRPFAAVMILAMAAGACTGSDAVLIGNSILAAGAAVNPAILGGLDGIPGWKRTGAPRRFNKEGLYGHIDGGAEIVLPYGFRELSVSTYAPAGETATPKEIVLEIYRMTSGEAAFGIYSTKLEGGERGWPGVEADNWIGGGQANFVKGEFLVNVLAPDCTDEEIGRFMAAVEKKAPGRGTERPKGLERLPKEDMIPSSWRYLKGTLAAQNESPFLEGGFWGFEAGEKDATVAYAAKYGAIPVVSKLVLAELGKAVETEAVDAGVAAAFGEYLRDVRHDGTTLAARNEAGRWFLFKRLGAFAALVLGEPDLAAARARLDRALASSAR